MTDARIDRLKTCYTGVIHDVMRAAGFRNFTLPPRITPLQPEITLCGPAFTIEGRLDETADAHETLLAWTGLLSKCKPGYIWTAQPHTHILAQMSELSAETLHSKGVLGCVLDGALRDSHFLLDLGFPSWRTHHTPKDIVGQWLPTGFDLDIMIEDVLIRPGDWLHGDRDGMVCIPVEHLEDITYDRSVVAPSADLPFWTGGLLSLAYGGAGCKPAVMARPCSGLPGARRWEQATWLRRPCAHSC